MQIIKPAAVDAVKQGTNATNHIEIEVHANKLKISINGVSLGEGSLDEPIRGMVGLLVTSHTDSVQARFDNFRLEPLQ